MSIFYKIKSDVYMHLNFIILKCLSNDYALMNKFFFKYLLIYTHDT